MFRFQLNFLTLCFVLIPWTIVVISWIQLRHSPRFPVASRIDLMEIQRLTAALQRYKMKYGEFPPDFTSKHPQQEIDQHLSAIFPSRDCEQDVPILTDELGPENALAFWLSGFSQDPRFPLTGPGRRRHAFFNFENRRLLLGNRYVPNSSKLPYVYFRSQGTSEAKYVAPTRNGGTARPYFRSSGGEMINEFQVLAAGTDNHFGDMAIPVEDAHLHRHHSDNLTSFRKNALGMDGATRERNKRQRNFSRSLPVAVFCLFLNIIFRWLRSRASGLLELRRVTAHQYDLASPTWANTLMEQRRSDRARAVRRFGKQNNSSL